MKAWIKVLLVAVLLASFTGCTTGKIQEENLSVQMTQIIEQSVSNKVYPSQNNHKELFSYYLPFNVGKKESTEISTILTIEGYDVVMNLNVSAVLSEKYYSTATYNTSTDMGTMELGNSVFTTNGFYKDYDDKEQRYSIHLTKVDDGSYFLLLKTKYFTYLTNVSLEMLPLVTEQLFGIARTTRINSEKIVTAYSKKEQIKFEQKIVQIYQAQVPINGALSEMIYGYSTDDFDWSIDELEFNDEGKKNSQVNIVEVGDDEDNAHDIETNNNEQEDQQE